MIVAVPGRFTAGWYWLFIMTAFSHLVVTLALVAESNRLYARLALTTSARAREREARLMSVDAVAAAISHEVGQPLAALRTNAMVGLNWLTRPSPNVEMAIQSMRATVDAGDRAIDVIKSVRALFARRPGRSVEFSLNDLVLETVSQLDWELAGERIALQLSLDGALPPIRGDRVQIQRVLANLVSNAIESLGATEGRPRRLEIRSAALDGHDVLLEVADNGLGIVVEEIENIFEAFFTTKTTGTGLGLSLSRTIVEVHGGRLWAAPGPEHGATFHMQLPVQRVARAAPASTPTAEAALR
jgi:signal transduction histidine kinase